MTMRPDLRTTSAARLLPALLGGVLVLGAGACGSEQPGPAAGTTSGTTSGTTAATSTGTPGVLAGPVVLTRTGGIAGMHDAVVLNPDGTYTVSRKVGEPVTRTADPAQVKAIADAVEQANLPALPASTPDTTTSDQIYYKLSVGSRTYVINGTQTPEEVKPLIEALGELFSAPAPTP
ncbi:protealysin inhibitor emfourin [Angustibacter luteus]|uniref:Protealysin inhibitor emfourin n=1 Tax=Angustibacter luteus TaxID=658456 RepID=A0ABW1JK18_9ACTN